ncbi:hypothetical protein AAFF_G00023820 [Aldrovandia affinis]|uniref:Uncharacterized protein n=1 Tax=Aldrovandia affinis TaxID=143900 RepID=A0AAD7T5M6_9TELE|nr:hypothetical protein AAFF_G00023820 [Aldrovandia affinis]
MGRVHKHLSVPLLVWVWGCRCLGLPVLRNTTTVAAAALGGAFVLRCAADGLHSRPIGTAPLLLANLPLANRAPPICPSSPSWGAQVEPESTTQGPACLASPVSMNRELCGWQGFPSTSLFQETGLIDDTAGVLCTEGSNAPSTDLLRTCEYTCAIGSVSRDGVEPPPCILGMVLLVLRGSCSDERVPGVEAGGQNSGTGQMWNGKWGFRRPEGCCAAVLPAGKCPR